MKRICIWGGWYGSRNDGDNAILIGLAYALKKKINNVQITVFSKNPEYIAEEYKVQAFSPHGQLLNILKSLSKTDLFIIGGGTPLFEDFHQLLILTFYFVWAKLFRKRIMIYAISAQDFKKRLSKFLIKTLLNRVDLITVRDPETRKILEEIGVSKKIYLTADPAILLKPASSKIVKEILTKEGILKMNKPLIGICPRYISHTEHKRVYHPELTKENVMDFKKIIAKIIEHLSEFAEVVFIPLHTEYPDDDLRIIEEIMGITKNPIKIKLIKNQYKPHEVMGIIGAMDLLIGVRLHSLVFAAATYVPSVAISYGPKVKGFMEMIGQEKYTCILESLEFNDLQARVDDVWFNKAFIKEDLKSRMKELRKLALTNAELAAKLIYTPK
jgi:polysaccharide pyruvyl transferase CsaB